MPVWIPTRTRIGPDSEGAAAVLRRLEGAVRRAEREEEGVPLGVDLDPAVASEGFPKHTAMLGEGVRVSPLTQFMQQAGGSFDVREQERHRSRR